MWLCEILAKETSFSAKMADNVVEKVEKLLIDGEKKEGRVHEGKKGKKDKDICSATCQHPVELEPPPAFIAYRQQLWDNLKKDYDEWVKGQPPQSILIKMPDGKKFEGLSWRTTPFEVARSISQGFADEVVISKVNGDIWDLDRPFESDADLKLLKFDDPEARAVFWHSSAHILGEAMERHYGGHMCCGSPTEEEFHYDMALDSRQVSSYDYPNLETIVKEIVSEQQPFERLEMKKEDLLKMFQYNEFKLRIINEKIDTPTTTVYRCGPLIDLCRGPHVRHTGKVKALQITKNSCTCWEGKHNRESIQRIYGVSFPDSKQLKEWQKIQEEAAKCNICNGDMPLCHSAEQAINIPMADPNVGFAEKLCKLGEDGQKFFTFSLPNGKVVAGILGQTTPYNIIHHFGASGRVRVKVGGKEWNFFDPLETHDDVEFVNVDGPEGFSPGPIMDEGHDLEGSLINNALCNMMRSEFLKRGFLEVFCKNFHSQELNELSVLWQSYAENMFAVDEDKGAMKASRCGGHCVIFSQFPRTMRELPLRFTEFGFLHENEISGHLPHRTGVRQCDGHIFCMPNQIKDEIAGCLDFLHGVYTVVGFSFQLRLSTRPEKFFGDVQQWDEAEQKLIESLDEFGDKWEYNHGDGAFYGPKIDITIMDVLKRPHQCATIQLDFQLPQQFNLSYISGDLINSGDEKSEKRPVIIHRAILGSVERMVAVLYESYGGKWPFWLSPRQCMVIPVAAPFDAYAQKVKDELFGAGFLCEADLNSGDTMINKICNAELAQYNFILVVGEKEQQNKTVNLRTRDNKVLGEQSLAQVKERFKYFAESKVVDAEDKY